MKYAHPIAMLTCGIAAGIGFVLSCGNSGPRQVDAADAPTCMCPTAEPPVPSRVVEKKVEEIVPKNTPHISFGAACPIVPAQSIVLNGGCMANIPQQGAVSLQQSFPDSQGWACGWSNPSDVDVPVTIIVRCLVPAS